MYNRMVVVKSRRKGNFFLSGSCNSNLVRAKEGERGGGRWGANLIVPGRTAESEYEQYRKQ